jgi:hypothetical protein
MCTFFLIEAPSYQGGLKPRSRRSSSSRRS